MAAQATFRLTNPSCEGHPFCINAIVNGQVVRQLAIFRTRVPMQMDDCFTSGLLSILGTYDGEICYGEAWLRGEYSTVTAEQAKRIADYVARDTDFRSETNNFIKYANR